MVDLTKIKGRVVLLAAALLICAVILTQTLAGGDRPDGAAAAKWQHLALTEKLNAAQAKGDEGYAHEIAGQIVKLGQQGWELVSVANFSIDGTTTKTVYYFKRPL